jgi:small subunit ribosomal protein S21
MLYIKINGEKGLETALKLYKNQLNKIKQIQQLRDKQEFVKPSVRKRKQRLKAIYIQQKKKGLDD